MLHPWQTLKLHIGNKILGWDNLAALYEIEDKQMPTEALLSFLRKWFDSEPTMELQTSGSTGTPKRITVLKKYMLASAEMSCRYFNLTAQDTALLCMDLKYIGAMMLVVRAMYSGMRLIVRQASADPLSDPSLSTEAITFAALVPLQVHEALKSGATLLRSIKQIIIGGAAVPSAIRERLGTFPNQIYASYGMTETLSHIALARLNEKSQELVYEALGGITLHCSARHTLIIDAPQIGVNMLETNDLVKLIDPKDNGANIRFCLLGRADLVINTGGVKVHINELEEILSRYISKPLAITKCRDQRLGEKIVLVIEGEASLQTNQDLNTQINKALENLPPYHRPKHIISIPRLPRLQSGKVDRQALLSLYDKEP